MSKPFSIQSPENIAMEYGGNKQKIAQAMQLGVVDPTAGVLAGMFIDRMRSAQMQEQAPQATVAQQVMGGVPPVPPTAPSGGLGATPQAAPPMAPAQMGMPPEAAMAPPQGEMMAPPQEEAPMGMAEGGIVGIDIPDTMFDESSNGGFDDGYAGGGLVAFADGGDVPSFAGGNTVRDPLSWLHAPITSLYGVKRSTGAHQGQDFGVSKDTPIGVPAPGKVVTASTDDVNGNFVVVEHPDGTRSSYSHLSAFNVKPGQVVDAGEVIGLSGNTGRVRGKGGGYHLHFGARDAEGNRINPTDFFNRIAPQTASGKFRQPPAADPLSDAEVPDILALAARNRKALSDNMSPETKRRQELIAEIEAGLAPEAQKKLSDQSKWEALAQFGFNLAGGQSPNFLQGLGQAAAETLPALAKARSEQKAASRADRQALATLEKMSNEEKQQMEQMALELAKAQAGLLSDERKMDLQLAIAQMDDNTRKALGYMTTYADIWGKSFGERRADYRARLVANTKTGSDGTAPGVPSATGDGGQSTVTNVGGWND